MDNVTPNSLYNLLTPLIFVPPMSSLNTVLVVLFPEDRVWHMLNLMNLQSRKSTCHLTN
jgi:hypothetical protein